LAVLELMAVFQTGEERTITYTGSLTGTAYTDTQCVDGFALTVAGNFCEWYIDAFFCQLYGRISYKSNYEGDSCALAEFEPDTITKTIETSAKWHGVEQDYHLTPTDINGLGLYSTDADGTYTITFVAQEYIDIDAPPAPLVDLDGFPDYSTLDEGGGPVDDGITSRRCFFFEYAKEDTDLVATITVGGQTSTFTIPITSGNAFPVLIDGNGTSEATYIIELYCKNSNVAAGSGTTAATCTALGVALGVAYTKTNGSQTVTAATGCSATSNLGGYAVGDMYLSPDLKYDVSTAAYCFDTIYPGTVVANLRYKKLTDTTINMGDSLNITQLYHVCGASLNGSTETQDIADEQGLIRAWLRQDSLSANGEDTDDWRLQWRGVEWKAGSILQDNPFVLDAGTSGTDWSGGANTTYSNTGSAHRAVVSGGAGSIAWDKTKNLEGYRYLEIDVKSTDDGKPFVLHFTHTDGEDKSYTGQTVGSDSFSTVRFDLCKPDDITDDDDSANDDIYTQDSRYPLEAGSTSVPTLSDALWGFNEFDNLTINSLEDGQTYEFKNLKLVKKTFAQVDFLPAFEPWKDGYTSNQVKSQFWTNADGRVADDHLATKLAASYSWLSITGFGSALERREGWTWGAAGTLPADGYHTNSLEALLLEGGGVRLSGGDFIPAYALDVSTEKDIYAQALWDEVRGYPEIGDKFNGGGYGGALVTGTAKQLRGQARGLIYKKASETPIGGVVVSLKTNPGLVAAGSGASDVQGFYVTGSPFGKNASHKAYCKDLVSPAFTIYNRFPHRFSWLPNVQSSGITYCVSPDYQHFRAYVGADGFVVTERADNLLNFLGETQDFTADSVDLEASKTARGILLYLTYSDAGDCYRRTSSDGVNWSMATAIGTGTHTKEVCLADGRRIEYWLDGTDIKGQFYDAADNALGSDFVAIAGVDDAHFGAGESVFGQSRWRVTINCTISGSPTVYTSPDGKTFT
jgi:hypothetical protein